MQRMVIFPLLLSLYACAGKPPLAADGGETQCVNPRPEVCTMDYTPVCATRADGSTATYSNGCSACSDAEVVSHRPGACE
jgi:hypothetical protein